MSQYAKAIVAAVAAVLIAGIDAWQTVTAGAPFRLLDVLPIATAVAGAGLTLVAPNVPEAPTLKATVGGVLAVLTAVVTFATGHPADVTLLNLIVAGLGALLTWYVPNLDPEAGAVLALGAAAAHATVGHLELDDVAAALRQLEQLDPTIVAATSATPVIPRPADPVEAQRQLITAGLARLDELDAADATKTAEQPAVVP
jgi:hypothetical protein